MMSKYCRSVYSPTLESTVDWAALGRLGMLYLGKLTSPVFRKQHIFCKSPAKLTTPIRAI